MNGGARLLVTLSHPLLIPVKATVYPTIGIREVNLNRSSLWH
jgi:hypothetical protein